MYLEKINGPEDVKKLKVEELQPLADEVRKAVINRVSKIGGHKGSNLGMVEMTVALHYVLIHLSIKLFLMFPISVIRIKS